MGYNLPDGCSEEDIEVASTGRPMSELVAKQVIITILADEDLDQVLSDPFSLQEIAQSSEAVKDAIRDYLENFVSDERVEEEFKENWSYVNYSSKNGGSGWVNA